jgi:hypothetical protein
MNATLRTLAGLLFTAAAVAGTPAPRIVVLDNENLVEGEVSKVAEGYLVRRPVGGDMTLPADRVVAVVADRKAAFAVVLERANRRDADEHLRLARWCAANGLPTEALAEAKSAARMRPGFVAAERFAEFLAASAQKSASDPAVTQAKAETPAKDTVTDVPAVEYNSDSFPLFASRVNAILLNTCANCHARDDVKAFHLTRVGGRGGVSRNLMAALPHVNPTDPAASPILVKAVTPHGGATEAPFKNKAHPAYQALESWARVARSADGTPPEPAFPARDPAEPRKLPDLPPPPPTGDAFGQDSKSVPPKPTRTEASDPFDPAIFNGEVKPKKN